MCPPGYHHDSFVVTQMYELQQSHVAIITDRTHCFRDYIYIYIYIFTGKFVYMAHHFILPRLNPFGLRVDREGWWFEHSMS